MSLGSGKSLPSDGGSIGNTYCLILTTHILTTFCVGSGGVGVFDGTPGPRNGRANVRNGAVRIRDIARDVGNGGVNIWNG